MSNPSFVVTRPGVAVATVKSNAGPPVSERSMPNTSQITPNSNGARPGTASATDFVEHPELPREVGRNHPLAVNSATFGPACQCPKLLAWKSQLECSCVVGMLGLGGIGAAISLVRRDGYRRVPTRLQR